MSRRSEIGLMRGSMMRIMRKRSQVKTTSTPQARNGLKSKPSMKTSNRSATCSTWTTSPQKPQSRLRPASPLRPAVSTICWAWVGHPPLPVATCWTSSTWAIPVHPWLHLRLCPTHAHESLTRVSTLETRLELRSAKQGSASRPRSKVVTMTSPTSPSR